MKTKTQSHKQNFGLIPCNHDVYYYIYILARTYTINDMASIECFTTILCYGRIARNNPTKVFL